MLYRFARKLVRENVRISQTELTALTSGIENKPSHNIENHMFRGRSIQPLIKELKIPTISSKAQRLIDDYVAPLNRHLNNYDIANKGGLTEEQFNLCRPLFGLGVSSKYGGSELGIHDQSQIVQYMNSKSIVGGITVIVPNSLGPAELISHYGTKDQKDAYLGKLASGDLIPCFGLTGTFSGSDAANMYDRGILFRDDDGDVKIKISCDKRYITLAPKADLIGLAFILEDPDNILQQNKSHIGITLALLDRETDNVEIGDCHDPMRIGMCNGTITGENIVISVDQIIGGLSQAGQGWKMLMECLTVGRGVSLPAASISSLKIASSYTGAYARIRKQFNRPLAELQGVQEHLSSIVYHTIISTASQNLFNSIADEKPELISPTLSAVLKLTTTERARIGINHSMDVLGGMGICDGPNNVISGIYQSIPIPITVEGSNTLTRSLIIYGQGLLRGRDDLREIWESTNEDDEAKFNDCFQELIKNSFFDVLTTILSNFYPSRLENTMLNTIDPYISEKYKLDALDNYIDHLQKSYSSLIALSIPILPKLKSEQVFSGYMANIYCSLYEIEALKWFRAESPHIVTKDLLQITIL